MINKRLARNARSASASPEPAVAAGVEQLRAPSVHATGGVTLGGQTLWRGDRHRRPAGTGLNTTRCRRRRGAYPCHGARRQRDDADAPLETARRVSAIRRGLDWPPIWIASGSALAPTWPSCTAPTSRRSRSRTLIPIGACRSRWNRADLQRKLVARAARWLLLRAQPAAGRSAAVARRRGRADARPRPPRPGAERLRRPRTHLVLRVRLEGAAWLADVGFGNGTLPEPIPFGPGASRAVGLAFSHRVDGGEHVLQTAGAGPWSDLYGFVPERVPEIDIETSNWFTCTHPRSPFVTGLVVSRQQRQGTRISLSDWHGLSLIEETAAQRPGPRIPWRDPGASGAALRPPGL